MMATFFLFLVLVNPDQPLLTILHCSLHVQAPLCFVKYCIHGKIDGKKEKHHATRKDVA